MSTTDSGSNQHSSTSIARVLTRFAQIPKCIEKLQECIAELKALAVNNDLSIKDLLQKVIVDHKRIEAGYEEHKNELSQISKSIIEFRSELLARQDGIEASLDRQQTSIDIAHQQQTLLIEQFVADQRSTSDRVGKDVSQQRTTQLDQVEASEKDFKSIDSEHARLIKKHYDKLVILLCSKGRLAMRLYQKDALTYSDKQTLDSKPTMMEANVFLLDLITVKPTDVYDRFLKVLRQTNQTHVYRLLCFQGYTVQTHHAKQIRKLYTALIDDLDIRHGLLDHLYSSGVIDELEKEDITSQRTTHIQTDTLLTLLSRKPAEMFELFLVALRNTEQGFLADKLQGFDTILADQPAAVYIQTTSQSHIIASRPSTEGKPLPEETSIANFSKNEQIFACNSHTKRKDLTAEIRNIIFNRVVSIVKSCLKNSDILELKQIQSESATEQHLETIALAETQIIVESPMSSEDLAPDYEEHPFVDNETLDISPFKNGRDLLKVPEPSLAESFPCPVVSSKPQLRSTKSLDAPQQERKSRLRTITTSGTEGPLLLKPPKSVKLTSEQYAARPTLLHKIEGRGEVKGLAYLDHYVYVAWRSPTVVTVYELPEYNQHKDITLNGVSCIIDIASCPSSNYIYALCQMQKRHMQILKMHWCMLILRQDGRIVRQFNVEELPRSLSVPSPSTVLITHDRFLCEYHNDVGFVRKIPLTTNLTHPYHAILTVADTFLVAHGCGLSSQHRVCVVKAGGGLLQTYGGSAGSGTGQLREPYHLALDDSMRVLIADNYNHRVQLLDPCLRHIRCLVGTADGISYPRRLCLDTLRGILYVGLERCVMVFNILAKKKKVPTATLR